MSGPSKKSWPFDVPHGFEAWRRCRALETEISKAEAHHFESTFGMTADAAEPVDDAHDAAIEGLRSELFAIRTRNLVNSARRWNIEVPTYPGPEWIEPVNDGLSYLGENNQARLRSQIWERRTQSIKFLAWVGGLALAMIAALVKFLHGPRP